MQNEFEDNHPIRTESSCFDSSSESSLAGYTEDAHTSSSSGSSSEFAFVDPAGGGVAPDAANTSDNTGSEDYDLNK